MESKLIAFEFAHKRLQNLKGVKEKVEKIINSTKSLNEKVEELKKIYTGVEFSFIAASVFYMIHHSISALPETLKLALQDKTPETPVTKAVEVMYFIYQGVKTEEEIVRDPKLDNLFWNIKSEVANWFKNFEPETDLQKYIMNNAKTYPDDLLPIVELGCSLKELKVNPKQGAFFTEALCAAAYINYLKVLQVKYPYVEIAIDTPSGMINVQDIFF